MESLSAYIPSDRRQALAKGIQLPNRTTGAGLYVDISGFTSLTEAFANAYGAQRGAEEITSQLNRLYEALIVPIDHFGGSVIGFSGDAMTCWFDQDDGQSALAAAFEIQNAMKTFAEIKVAAEQVAKLSVKVAVAAGPARRFVVGEAALHYMDVVAGETLERLAAAEQNCKKGEVIMDETSAQSLLQALKIQEWRAAGNSRFAVIEKLNEGFTPQTTRVEIPELPEQVVRPWVIPAIYHRIQQGQGEFLAELRSAVPLFISFGGIDYDHDEAAGEKLNAYICWAQKIFAKYDGVLFQITTGEKGNFMYGTFGAPIAHDDDALRAVSAALELRVLPPELSFISNIKIGISRGRLRAGPYGSPTRRAYGVMGEETNLAARLMQKAQAGEILVTQRVADAAGKKYQFVSLDTIPLKGVSQPVAVYTVSGQSVRPDTTIGLQKQSRSVIVGRTKEKVFLAEQLENLRSGKTPVLTFIQGDAGIGKSRLVAELVELCNSNRVQCLVGAGDAVERNTAYLAWRSVFARFFEVEGISEHSSAEDLEFGREKITMQVEEADANLVALLPLLNVFLSFQFPDNEVTSQLAGEVRAVQTQNLCAALFKHAAAQAPLTLVMEDAHWLDSASWSLLNAVTSAVPLLFVVIAMRPAADMTQPEMTRLLQRPDAQTLVLDSLPDAETEALICYRLKVSSLPREVAQFIHERAEGNPFFSEELAYALRDSGLLIIENNQCRLAPKAGDLTNLNFPSTVDGVIINRIDNLPPSEQLLLKVASVVGRIFALRTLREIHPVEADRKSLAEYLSHLRALDITPLEIPDPDQAYIFKHIITHEVAYNLLLFQQRRDLHRIVAEWYERAYTDDLSQFYPLLAHHWRIAENPEKQLKYLELAGKQAIRIGAYREAIGFFQELLTLNEKNKIVSDETRLANWERELGEAFFSIGDFTKSKEYHLAAVKRLGRPFTPAGAGLIFQLLGEANRQFIHRMLPARFVGTKQDAKNIEKYLEGARAYERISHIVYFENNTFGTVASGLASLNLSERVPASPELVRAYGTTEVTTGLMGMHPAALNYERLAKEASEAVRGQPGYLAAEGWRLMMVGTYHAGADSLKTAINAMNDAIKIWEQIGEKQRWKETLSLVSTMNIYYADLPTAYQLIERFYQAALQEKNEQFRFWALLTKAMGLEIEGKLKDAHDALMDALSGGLAMAPSDQIWHGGILARVLLAEGQFEQAVAEAEKVAKVIEAAQPTAYYVLSSYSAVIEVFLAGMEKDAARRGEYQKRAVKILGKLKAFSTPFPIAKARLNLLTGRYNALGGKTSAARSALQQSLADAERLDLRYDRALAHLELSKYESAALHREKAQALLAEIGAKI